MATRSIVYWECQSPDHRGLHSRHANGGLTIHEGAWAYCDGAGADDAHQWSATGGASLESLVRWTAPMGASVQAEPPAAAATTSGDPNGSRKTPGVRRT